MLTLLPSPGVPTIHKCYCTHRNAGFGGLCEAIQLRRDRLLRAIQLLHTETGLVEEDLGAPLDGDGETDNVVREGPVAAVRGCVEVRVGRGR